MVNTICVIAIMLAQILSAEPARKENLAKLNRFVVSVSGAVKNSNVIRSDKAFTLKSALQICGGLSENASPKKIDVFRFGPTGEFEVKRLQVPRDLNFKFQHRDMVVIRHNIYWSSRKEEAERVKRILAEEK